MKNPFLRRARVFISLLSAWLCAGGLWLCLSQAPATWAAPVPRPLLSTFVVTSTANSGAGTLRQAILDANVNPGADVINFSLSGCPCVIALSSALPTITDSLTIVGTGMDMLALDGGNVAKVLSIGGVPVTLSDLTVQRGNGGGISTIGALTLTNVAVLSNTVSGAGGGVYAQFQPVVVHGGLFQNNTGDSGGGLYLYGIPALSGTLTISGTRFVSNTALYGGGAVVVVGATQVNRSLFQNNRCANSACQGGALSSAYATLNVTDTQFISNTALGHGGGVAVTSGSSILKGVTLERNQCQESACQGGGFYVDGTLQATATQFLSNTAVMLGGGAYVTSATTVAGSAFQNNVSSNGAGGGLAVANGSVSLSATQFISNSAAGYGGGVYALATTTVQDSVFQRNRSASGGGGLQTFQLILLNTQLISNTAPDGGGARALAPILRGSSLQENVSTNGKGGGLYATSGALTISDTQFLSNTAQTDGGGAYAPTQATLQGGLFQANRSVTGNGGGLYVNTTLNVTATQFLHNTANAGGGVYQSSSASGRIVNTLLAGNTALTTQGAALYANSSTTLQILHTTIASPTVTSDAALYVAGGNVGITNTVIVSHGIGISNAGGVVFENYNLFFGNTANTLGAVMSGGNSVTGTPAFVHPASGNYRLGSGSMAINAGADVSITTDFDGDARPIGSGFDSGYDEAQLADLSLGKFVTPDPVLAGATLYYTLSLANNGPLTATNVVLTDALPTGATLSSFSTPQGSCSGATLVTCNLGSIANGVTVSVMLTVAAPTTLGAAVNNATATSALVDLNLLDNSATVTTTVNDVPISGLSASNSSVTVLGNATTLTAMIAAGTNVTYTWNFGDNLPTANGAVVTHTYAAVGTYTATVTATNSVNSQSATTMVTVTGSSLKVYLPLVTR
jgi:uncharacterized repeat protein (TIGR01451 family)